jgi:hypothetical protein
MVVGIVLLVRIAKLSNVCGIYQQHERCQWFGVMFCVVRNCFAGSQTRTQNVGGASYHTAKANFNKKAIGECA